MLIRQKLMAIAITCFMFVGVGNGFAGELQKHTFELGPEISRITYEEPRVMKEEGMMYGLAASYTYHNKLMLKAEGRGSMGSLDYKNSGTVENIPDYMLEFRGTGGYDFPISEVSFLTPYAGIGYRYLNDDGSGKTSSTGARGYERESNYLYSPIGVALTAPLKNGWSFGATAEYDIFWWGKQISHLSDGDPGFNDPENRQKKGYGARGSVKLEKKGKKLNFVIEPFVRYWNIKKSKDADLTYYGTYVGYGYEPKNHSTEFGIKLAVMF